MRMDQKNQHNNTIYTIGYGNRTMAAFVALLRQYDIDFLVDVRSAPYSKYNTDFTKSALAEHMKRHDIGYVYMGDQLGGKPKTGDFFTDGKVDYAKLNQADFYREGIERLKTALQKQYRVALMCAELRPETCHRSKLVGQSLVEETIAVQHIDELGQLKSQTEVMDILTGGQQSLFDESFTSVKKYR